MWFGYFQSFIFQLLILSYSNLSLWSADIGLQRLDSYYKRNYKDYFEFVEGSLAGKEQLSESEKGILDWLQKNKWGHFNSWSVYCDGFGVNLY